MDTQNKATTTPSWQGLSQNVSDAQGLFDELDIEAVLDGGALLGLHRDGGPIKGDEDDVDFLVDYGVFQFDMLALIDAFVTRGFDLFRLRDTVMTFKRNGVKIDLLSTKWSEEWGMYYITLYHQKRPFALKIPKHVMTETHEADFCGTSVSIPNAIESYLEWRFGDWQTPVLRPSFSFKNYLDTPGLTEWL